MERIFVFSLASEVVNTDAHLIFPMTSKACTGELVPIPTIPPPMYNALLLMFTLFPLKFMDISVPAGVLNRKLARSPDVLIYDVAVLFSYIWKPHPVAEFKAPPELSVSNPVAMFRDVAPRVIFEPGILTVSLIVPRLMMEVLLAFVAIFTVVKPVPVPRFNVVVVESQPTFRVPPDLMLVKYKFELLTYRFEQAIMPP